MTIKDKPLIFSRSLRRRSHKSKKRHASRIYMTPLDYTYIRVELCKGSSLHTLHLPVAYLVHEALRISKSIHAGATDGSSSVSKSGRERTSCCHPNFTTLRRCTVVAFQSSGTWNDLHPQKRIEKYWYTVPRVVNISMMR